TDGFKIGVLWYHVNSESELENLMKSIEHFPRCKNTVILKYLIPTSKLLSLPPMEEMHVLFRIPIDSNQFIYLISLHKLIHFYYATVTVNGVELKQIIKMILSESRERTVRVIVDASMLFNWLRSEGFNESSKAGESSREFELVKLPDEN
ncbi:hypothetical protein PMAYCL1PPCAC_31704, partial [Pristionchus mayeri]